jgi:hypothetical protein
LPCSTRSSMRSESMSPTLSATTSETRSPAPPAFAGAGSGGAQRRLVLRIRRRLEQQCDLLDAEHGRQPARFAHDGEPPGEVRPVERHGEEETQRRHRTVDARRLHAGLRLVQLEAAQILRRCRIGRPADKGRERPHVANVVVARLLDEAAHPDVLDHPRPQRANRPVGRMGGHRGPSLEPKVAGPSMLGIECPDRHALLFTRSSSLPRMRRPRRSLLPRERFGRVPGMLNSSAVKVLCPT